MKIKKRLTKSALNELREQYSQIKQESDAAYQKWSELNINANSIEKTLALNGVKLKAEEGSSKVSTAKSSASTLRLAITKILKAQETAIKAREIRERLKRNKVPFKQSYFWRVLNRMERKGTIKRVGTGLYQLQNGAT